MKPSARMAACLEIFGNVIAARIPMDLTIGDYMRPRRYVGAKDRAFIAEQSYRMIRHYARVRAICAGMELAFTPRHAWLVFLCVYGLDSDSQALSLPRIRGLFDGSKYAPEPLNPAEEELVTYLLDEGKENLEKSLPEQVTLECPEAHYDTLKELYGADFYKEMQGFIESASLDVRVNLWKTDREAIVKSMADDGVEVAPTPYSPWGLRCAGKVHLAKTKAFKKGLIEIQDEGSQLISLLCAPAPGMQILDFCAGGGGKTLGLSAAMQGKGRLVATDIGVWRFE